jgi:hypothetical protein
MYPEEIDFCQRSDGVVAVDHVGSNNENFDSKFGTPMKATEGSN